MSLGQIEIARDLLREGLSMDEVAKRFGILRRELDLELWQYIGCSTARDLYQPQFD